MTSPLFCLYQDDVTTFGNKRTFVKRVEQNRGDAYTSPGCRLHDEVNITVHRDHTQKGVTSGDVILIQAHNRASQEGKALWMEEKHRDSKANALDLQ